MARRGDVAITRKIRQNPSTATKARTARVPLERAQERSSSSSSLFLRGCGGRGCCSPICGRRLRRLLFCLLLGEELRLDELEPLDALLLALSGHSRGDGRPTLVLIHAHRVAGERRLELLLLSLAPDVLLFGRCRVAACVKQMKRLATREQESSTCSIQQPQAAAASCG